VSDLHELLLRGSKGSERSVIRALMIMSGNQTHLAKLSGISPASVTSVLKELQENRIVRRIEGGREKVSQLEPVDGVAVGVELGYQRSFVVARRIDSPDTEPIYERVDVGANNSNRGNDWIKQIASSIRRVTQDLREPFDDVATVGLGIPRMVNPRTEELTAPVLPPWTDVPHPAASLQEELRADAPDGSLRSQVKVKLDNDATLGALAESVESVKESLDAEILLFIKASTGVGAGLVVGGKVVRGAIGVAGELGHVMVERHGHYCRCGGRGCLETVIGAEALLQNVRTALGRTRLNEPQNIDDLVNQAKDGDQLCRRVLREAAVSLGLTLGNVCNLLNPNIIVLGGALAKAGDLILGPCAESMRRTALAAMFTDGALQLKTSSLDQPVARGALIMGIQGTETDRD
jgi:predicted NBD/HSP70 family sugar kinase